MNRAPRLTLSLPAVLATFGALALPGTAAAACATMIGTVAELQAMQSNLAGEYCLANDIDASGLANFTPVGNSTTPFTGIFNGRGRVIRNLTINDDGTNGPAGLFGVAEDATIRDVAIVNANIVAPDAAGILAGEANGNTRVGRVRTHGQVACTADGCYVGGLIGSTIVDTPAGVPSISDSSSSATVIGGTDATAGGLIGELGEGAILRSYATGNVSATGSSAAGGGLVGFLSGGAVQQSFATGRVTADQTGGLIGQGPLFGSTITDSYAAGPARGAGSAGGLIGNAAGSTASETIQSSYAVGAVTRGATQGGLVALNGSAVVTNSYWDTETTGEAASAGGTAKTTIELRRMLQPGFLTTVWDVARNFSYPFLIDDRIDFVSPLATLVVNDAVYVFVPISQGEPSEYRKAPADLTLTSQAAAYAMIGRAIGNIDQASRLTGVKIDKFWNRMTDQAVFDPLAPFATLGTLVNLTANQRLSNANVVGAMKTRNQVVLLRGSYTTDAGAATHWLLGTMFKTNDDGSLRSIVANDPATGRQIEIDPAARTVLVPADFPLEDFKVDAYQAVTIN